jgi:hypothetical protein
MSLLRHSPIVRRGAAVIFSLTTLAPSAEKAGYGTQLYHVEDSWSLPFIPDSTLKGEFGAEGQCIDNRHKYILLDYCPGTIFWSHRTL